MNRFFCTNRYLVLIMILLGCCSCAPSTARWVSSSYSMIPEKSVNMGLMKTGSEPYPVMHIGNGIYIAILSDDGPVPSSVAQCKPISSLTLWVWSEQDSRFDVKGSYFLDKQGNRIAIRQVGLLTTPSNGKPDYQIDQQAVNIGGYPSASQNLIQLWRENKIQQLMNVYGRVALRLDLEHSAGCLTDTFEGYFKLVDAKGSELTQHLYFFPYFYDYYLLH